MVGFEGIVVLRQPIPTPQQVLPLLFLKPGLPEKGRDLFLFVKCNGKENEGNATRVPGRDCSGTESAPLPQEGLFQSRPPGLFSGAGTRITDCAKLVAWIPVGPILIIGQDQPQLQPQLQVHGCPL